LDGLASVNVEVCRALGCQSLNEVLRLEREPFHVIREVRRNRIRLATENDDLLAAIRPSIERQHEFEGISTQDDGIHGVYEFLVTIILLGRRAFRAGQPIEITIRPGNESVEAGRDEHRRLDAH
jgi:hypothetical protein